jgi:hypothetical protein
LTAFGFNANADLSSNQIQSIRKNKRKEIESDSDEEYNEPSRKPSTTTTPNASVTYCPYCRGVKKLTACQNKLHVDGRPLLNRVKDYDPLDDDIDSSLGNFHRQKRARLESSSSSSSISSSAAAIPSPKNHSTDGNSPRINFCPTCKGLKKLAICVNINHQDGEALSYKLNLHRSNMSNPHSSSGNGTTHNGSNNNRTSTKELKNDVENASIYDLKSYDHNHSSTFNREIKGEKYFVNRGFQWIDNFQTFTPLSVTATAEKPILKLENRLIEPEKRKRVQFENVLGQCFAVEKLFYVVESTSSPVPSEPPSEPPISV